MGESLVEIPAVEKKMDESVKSAPRLDVSVSFGRFENDILSWEKWSSFSPNKYLEEVGSLSTPGSVAQKKAYFEAHYKRIAAQKAEEMEQEKSGNSGTLSQENPCDENCVENPTKDESFIENHFANDNCHDIDNKCGSSDDGEVGKKTYFEAHYKKIAAKIAEELEQEKLISPFAPARDQSYGEDNVESTSRVDAKFGLAHGEKLGKENAEETCTTSLTDVTISDEAKDDNAASSEEVVQGGWSNGLIHTTPSDEKEDASVVDCESSIIENSKSELSGHEGDCEVNAREDAVLAADVTPLKSSRPTIGDRLGRKKVMERTSASKKENSRFNARTMPQKATPSKNEKNVAGTKKMAVTPASKPAHTSVRRYSMPTSISTPGSSSQSSKQKVNRLAESQSKGFLAKSKKAAPTALHLSFNLGPSNSSPVLPMTRKSLIMDRMGDKDIIKRAFKTFQNRTYGSSGDEKSRTVKQVSSPASDSKLSTVVARKRNEGLKKDVERLDPQLSQSATRSKTPSTRSYNSSPVNRKNATAASPSIGLRSDEKSEKRKEFLKKLEAKSIVRGTEKAQRSEKSKNTNLIQEAREAEMKKLRQSLNFKAKPLPSFYRVKGKSDLGKVSCDS